MSLISLYFSNKNDNIHKTKCKNETYLKNVIKNISNYRVALLLKRYSLPAGSRKWSRVASLLKTERDRLEKKIYKVFLPRRAIKGARRVGDPCRMTCRVRKEVWLEPLVGARIRKKRKHLPPYLKKN